MNTTLGRVVVAAGLLFTASAPVHAQFAAYAINTNASGVQQLLRLDPNAPGGAIAVGPTGVRLTGIDFRPLDNQLYGYDGDKLYTIDRFSGRAMLAFDVGNSTGNVGFDFNPTVDRVRVVNATGSNLRLNPLTGATIVDMPFSYAMGDVNFGRTPAFTAVAYTNSDTDPNTGTTLYGIDVGLGTLVRIASPNGGVVNTVGSLGIVGLRSVGGFDIFTVGTSNTGYIAATRGNRQSSWFYSVDLNTGAATEVKEFDVQAPIEGLALTSIPEPSTWALMAFGLAGIAVAARRRRQVKA